MLVQHQQERFDFLEFRSLGYDFVLLVPLDQSVILQLRKVIVPNGDSPSADGFGVVVCLVDFPQDVGARILFQQRNQESASLDVSQYGKLFVEKRPRLSERFHTCATTSSRMKYQHFYYDLLFRRTESHVGFLHLGGFYGR